jgi:IclR-like helix-turn-helix domain-containing protein
VTVRAGRATATETRGGHRAAHRVVDILELLAASRQGLALREVSAQLEAPKSSLLSLLRTLTARGLPIAWGRAPSPCAAARRPSASCRTWPGRRCWS